MDYILDKTVEVLQIIFTGFGVIMLIAAITTAYSIAKRANFHLDDEKADWRARLDKDKETGCYTLTATCLYNGRDMNGEYAGGAGRP